MARAKKADADKAKLQGIPQPLTAPPQVMMPHQHMQMPTMVPQHMQQQMGVPQPPMQQHQQPPPQQIQQQQPIAQGMQRVVDAEQFMRVRDSCLTRFATITGLIREFAHDYARQTNMLMGVGDQNGDDAHSSALLAQLDSATSQLMLNGLTDLVPAGEEKKERKKRVHDQNAPKRPLTPYFLYMQHARSVIAGDLGEDAPKGAVQTEGQRRWSQMSEQEKLGWNTAYQYNLRLYNARVHSYKIGGNPLAKDMSDEEALDYANAHNIPIPPLKDAAAAETNNEQAAIAEQLGADDGKTPKKNAAQRKRKSDAPADMNPAIPSPVVGSPDKKRRRVSGKPDGPEDAKKASRGKKAKN
jgi:hypothetical protein